MCKNPQIFFNKRNLTTHKKNYIPWLHEIYRKNARYISKAINMINHLIKKKKHVLNGYKQTFDKIKDVLMIFLKRQEIGNRWEFFTLVKISLETLRKYYT